MLGIGSNRNQQTQGQMVPMPQDMQGTTTVMNPRQMDTEFQKHILDINPMQLAFYKVFSGWREVTTEEELKLYGIQKAIRKTAIKIDYMGRAMNEAGANMLFTEVIPLINPASATSHVKPIEIWNLWNGHLLTIETNLLDSYYYPAYICQGKNCRFITQNLKLMKDHLKFQKHPDFEEVANPYEFDRQKYANVITFLCTLSIITAKAKEGFTLRELAESFMTQQVIRNGYQMQEQPRGLTAAVSKAFGVR